MSNYTYLFLKKPTNLLMAESPLIRGMWAGESQEELKEYPVCYYGGNDLHGGVLLGAFTEKPKSCEEMKLFFEKVLETRPREEKEKLVQKDVERHKEEIEYYENEPGRWKRFFEYVLKESDRLAFLITREGHEKKDSHLFTKKIVKKITKIDTAFFRSIEEDVLYEITR